VVWTHYLLLDFACKKRDLSLARFHLLRARSLAPLDSRLQAMASSCHLQ
jgi:hypothetical protein